MSRTPKEGWRLDCTPSFSIRVRTSTPISAVGNRNAKRAPAFLLLVHGEAAGGIGRDVLPIPTFGVRFCSEGD